MKTATTKTTPKKGKTFHSLWIKCFVVSFECKAVSAQRTWRKKQKEEVTPTFCQIHFSQKAGYGRGEAGENLLKKKKESLFPNIILTDLPFVSPGMCLEN